MKTIIETTKQVEREFSSMQDYTDYAQRETDAYEGNRESRKTDRYNNRWTETESFEHAIELADNGWAEGLESLRPISERVYKSTIQYIESEDLLYRIDGGLFVDVGRLMGGEPECFGTYEEVEEVQKVFRLSVAVFYSSGNSSEEIMRRGAAITALVDSAEHLGYSVELEAFFAVSGRSSGKDQCIHRIRLKNAGETLDLDTLAFALMNPSFCRRICFSAQEVEPNSIRERFGFNGDYYGTPSFDLPKNHESQTIEGLYMEALSYNNSAPFKSEESCADWVLKMLRDSGMIGGNDE